MSQSLLSTSSQLKEEIQSLSLMPRLSTSPGKWQNSNQVTSLSRWTSVIHQASVLCLPKTLWLSSSKTWTSSTAYRCKNSWTTGIESCPRHSRNRLLTALLFNLLRKQLSCQMRSWEICWLAVLFLILCFKEQHHTFWEQFVLYRWWCTCQCSQLCYQETLSCVSRFCFPSWCLTFSIHKLCLAIFLTLMTRHRSNNSAKCFPKWKT